MNIKNNQTSQTVSNYARKIAEATMVASHLSMMEHLIGNFMIEPFEASELIDTFCVDIEELESNTMLNYDSDDLIDWFEALHNELE